MTQPCPLPVGQLDLFDFLGIPHKGAEVDIPPGQIAFIIKAARRLKIARDSEFERQLHHIAVLPGVFAVLEMTNRDEDLARCRPGLPVLPDPLRLKIQPATGRTPFRLLEQPAFQYDFLRQRKMPEVRRRKIRSVDPLQAEIAGQERDAQQADQDGQPEPAHNPACRAECKQPAQPDGRSRLQPPGDAGLAHEIQECQMNEDRLLQDFSEGQTKIP